MNWERFIENARTLSLRSRRGGSVLIFVVALLVILSLIGISFLSAARTDRYSSHQNVTNTQIDLLVDGVVRMTESTVADDLFGYDADGTRHFRPIDALNTQYENWDAPSEPNDSWLAERVPQRHPVSGDPMWGFISGPIGTTEFETPDGDTFTTRSAMLPDTVAISGNTYPALTDAATGDTYLAADADGDGIADAGLWRLPTPAMDGVTYYAAVRIIDNAAAINVNTAWSRDDDYNAAGTAIANSAYFPSNIGLLEMLSSYDTSTRLSPEMDALNDYRFGGEPHASLEPRNDSNVLRTDFSFISQGDALFMQLGRRIENPGYNADGVRYRALGISDMLSLTYRFCLVNPNASLSTLETMFVNAANADSIYTSVRTQPYDPGDVEQWFEDNFDYDTLANPPLRALLTTRNGVSPVVRPHTLPTLATVQDGNGKGNSSAIELMPTFTGTPTKTSLASASFGELWRAYFHIMVENSSASGVTVPAGTEDTVFYPYLRDPRDPTHPSYKNSMVYTTLMNQTLIRAAQAAANTIDMRDADNDVSSYVIQILLYNANGTEFSPTNHGVVARIDGYEPQPFITEVYAQTNPKEGGNNKNPDGYFAIELYNPYATEIDIKNWRIAAVERVASSYNPGDTNKDMKDPVATFSTSIKIPAGGYLVIENFNRTAYGAVAASASNKFKADPAQTSPPSAEYSSSAKYAYVSNLGAVLGKEMLIVRPHDGDGVVDNGNEKDIEDFVPVDQFDFTGMPAIKTSKAINYHYARPHGAGNEWMYVHPGPYNSIATERRYTSTVQSDEWNTNQADPWTSTKVYLGNSNAAGTAYAGTVSNPIALPLYTTTTPTAATGNAYPFNFFAYAGDGLYVPFFGNHVIAGRQDNGNLKLKYPITINSLATDASFAIGASSAYPSFLDTTSNPWAKDYFEYFSLLNAPGSDYLPNIAASAYGGTAPDAVQNSASAAMDSIAPVHGLINVNTAPWKVLAALPMVSGAADNEALAKAIVDHRNAYGPFESIFDLNDVVSAADPTKGFQNAWGTISTTTPEARALMVRRISNLVTTRSDSYTCYVLVQGWRNIGTATPELVSQRRAAFIADRSMIDESDRSMSIVRVPTD